MIGEDVLREADRVADRLRVVLPRLLRREDDTAGRELLDRARATLQALADLGAEAQGRRPRPVPRLGPHAIPDQVTVLVHDLVGQAPEPGAFQRPDVAAAAHDAALTRAAEDLARLRAQL